MTQVASQPGNRGAVQHTVPTDASSFYAWDNKRDLTYNPGAPLGTKFVLAFGLHPTNLFTKNPSVARINAFVDGNIGHLDPTTYAPYQGVGVSIDDSNILCKVFGGSGLNDIVIGQDRFSYPYAEKSVYVVIRVWETEMDVAITKYAGAVVVPGGLLKHLEASYAKPAHQVSVPLVSRNGNFELGDKDWTKGTGWTIEDINPDPNVADWVGHKVVPAASDLSQATSLNNTDVVTFSYQIRNRTAGTLTPKIGAVTGLTSGSADGYYSVSITAGADNPDIILSADAAFDGDVDNVSVVGATGIQASCAHIWVDGYQQTNRGQNNSVILSPATVGFSNILSYYEY